MVIFGLGFQISNFYFEKNSTRKMTFFHPEKSQTWKMAIFRVPFSGWNFFEAKSGDMKFQPKISRLVKWSFSGWNFKSPIFASKKIHPENGHFPSLGFFGVENGHFPGGIRLENGLFPGWNLPRKMAIISRLGFVRMREIKYQVK